MTPAKPKLKIKRGEPAAAKSSAAASIPQLPPTDAEASPPALSFEDLFSLRRLRKTWQVLRKATRDVTARDVVDWLDWSISIDQSIEEIRRDVLSGTYVPQPPTRFEQAKSKGAYRVIASLNMRDALVYRHISDEALRRYLPKKVPGAFYSNKHSLTPVGKTFTFEGDSSHAFFEVWLRYNEYRARTMLNDVYKTLVVTDVTNYFESIHHELLLEYLAPLGLPREAAGLLGRLLEMLKPTTGHSPTPRVGLPVDEFDCSRQLGHVFLFEHDRRVAQLVGEQNYARWMDDQNIGVRNVTHARKIVNELTRSLYQQRLTLNAGKTKFLSPDEVVEHFQLDANELLNKIQKKTAGEKFDISDARTEFENVWSEINQSPNRSGNWDKVLKRAYGLATKVGSTVMKQRAFDDLVEYPELADRIVNYFARQNCGDELLALFRKYMNSGENLFEAVEFSFLQGLMDIDPTGTLAGKLTKVVESFAKCQLKGQTGRPLGRAAAVLLLYWLGYPAAHFAKLFTRAEARALPKEVARAWLACGFALEADAPIRAALMAHSAEDVGRLGYFLDDVVNARVASFGPYRKLRSRWPLHGEYYDARTWLQFDLSSRAPSTSTLGKRAKTEIEQFAKYATSRAQMRVLQRVRHRIGAPPPSAKPSKKPSVGSSVAMAG
jgi:hypothetical protein